jgi:hypothetical protein
VGPGTGEGVTENQASYLHETGLLQCEGIRQQAGHIKKEGFTH